MPTPKCSLWRCKWENKSFGGLILPDFLDRCKKCGWWKVWGLIPGGSFSYTYPPATFTALRNRKTGEKVYVARKNLEEAKAYLNRKHP